MDKLGEASSAAVNALHSLHRGFFRRVPAGCGGDRDGEPSRMYTYRNVWPVSAQLLSRTVTCCWSVDRRARLAPSHTAEPLVCAQPRHKSWQRMGLALRTESCYDVQTLGIESWCWSLRCAGWLGLGRWSRLRLIAFCCCGGSKRHVFCRPL